MSYQEELRKCKSVEKLMCVWKQKEPCSVTYNDGNEEVTIEINHGKNVFISDGAVNEKVWEACDGPKIAYILKEAYGEKEDWNLVNWLHDLDMYPNLWKRVAEWTYGVCNTTAENITRYDSKMNMKTMKEYLDKIAVINIKKSRGKSSSNGNEIVEYAKKDKEEIKKELELLSPDIVICGATIGAFDAVYDDEIKKNREYNDNWSYYTDKICGKETLVIDYYHPANHYPALINYYAVVNIYQQALKAKSK